MLVAALHVGASAETRTMLEEIGVKTVFPSGYVVVTPDYVSSNMEFFPGKTVDEAERELILSGVHAIAFSREGDVILRVIAEEGDETAAAYRDIEQYTTAMRTQIRNQFLDKANWPENVRYTDAEWTNKTGRGRILQLSYTVREGDVTVVRGRQAYTIRDGMAFTLDMQVIGRKLETSDEKMFDLFIGDTSFPVDESTPVLPVGLTLDSPLPEEVYKDTFTVKGVTTKGASITAYFQPDDSGPVEVCTTTAGNSGVFRLDITLPEVGDTRVYLIASLNGFEDSDVGGWVSYDPKRLPVSFTSYPDGLVTDSQIVISGKTIGGVDIQCMEGDTNKKARTGSDGKFSFTMDRNITGERTVVLSFTRDGFLNRRFTLQFNRQWIMEDYVKQLDKTVQPLSYQNLTERADRFIGRIVRYSGLVVRLSSAEGVTYVELATKMGKDETWGERIIAVAEGFEVPLEAGDMADIYFEVTGESYTFTGDDASDENDALVDLPAVKLVGYQKK